MDAIINFLKEIFMLDTKEKMPIGLCAFEYVQEQPSVQPKVKRKREMRLSELMDK